MHPVTELETSVPAFLGKLWRLVEDSETDDLICWAPNGRSFFIRNSAQFARELLPHYYKHNNMASFVRQLNMYGFHKKVSIDVGGLKCDRDEMEFAHQYFVKDHPFLLEHIKRKIATGKSQDGHPPIKAEVMNKVLSEVRTVRGRQEHLDSKLGAMKRENEALWRELAMLRRKHLKQQEIVNKLIHFLVTLVQPNRSGLPVKRRYPLMIDAHQSNKQMKMDKRTSEPSPTGPVIHELDASEHDQHEHDLDSQYIVAETLDSQQHPAVESPQSIDTGLDDDYTETMQYVDCSLPIKDEMQILEAVEVAHKRKNYLKQKKERKNKVPIKIRIPPMKDGGQPREETIMLEVNPGEAKVNTAPLTKKPAKITKPVPLKTVRSSKLAAMAANINKMAETDAESDDELKETTDTDPLDFDLIIPDMISEDNEQKTSENDDENYVNVAASSSNKSKDLSLRCVSPSNMTNNTYRLGPMAEVDNHLETVQNELDNLREVLRSEGCSIDANTLLGLFGNDDPMSFGIPMNPELDPTYGERDDEDYGGESNIGATGGELMAYNPSNNLLDFDDDMLLGVDNLDSIDTAADQDITNNYYSQYSTGLESDNKSLLHDARMPENSSQSSTKL